MILRYGTYVDVAAPIFSWGFFQEIVLQTLAEAQTGQCHLSMSVYMCVCDSRVSACVQGAACHLECSHVVHVVCRIINDPFQLQGPQHTLHY